MASRVKLITDTGNHESLAVRSTNDKKWIMWETELLQRKNPLPTLNWRNAGAKILHYDWQISREEENKRVRRTHLSRCKSFWTCQILPGSTVIVPCHNLSDWPITAAKIRISRGCPGAYGARGLNWALWMFVYSTLKIYRPYFCGSILLWPYPRVISMELQT